MIRLQILFVVFFMSNALTGYFAYTYAKGKQAIAENKIIENKIENHNEDIKAIEKHTKQIDNIRVVYRDSIAKIADIRPNDAAVSDSGCLRDDSRRLRNEIYDAFPSVHFQSADSMPSTDK